MKKNLQEFLFPGASQKWSAISMDVRSGVEVQFELQQLMIF
jgi:hypothetical protein